MDLFQHAECEKVMAFHEAWDSITKIEIEVDSYDELIMKSEIPPFPMGDVGGGVTPEQMEWMLRYGQRIDPAMPQRAMAHLGGPFVAPRSKAVFVNPANPNKVFKLNAGATLPIAFSHALAAMGYPVAPMTPMATFSTPNEYQDDATTSVVAQDRFDVVPSIGSGRRKSWPEGGDAYFDEYTWMDMFRDNIAGSKFAGTDVPEGSAPQWFDPEADYTRGIEFLQRQGVDMDEWAKDFVRANNENPDKFKPRNVKDTPQNRLVQALNDELRRYRQLDIQPDFDRFTSPEGELKRYSNIGGGEWEDPLLRFLQMDTYSQLGPNIGLDEQGRPILTSFGIRGSPTMRVGTQGYDSTYRPMVGPREEGVESDSRDRAARVMFGQPLPARKIGFEIDPIYGLPRLVEETVMREQAGGDSILDAETMQALPYTRRLIPPYSNMSREDVFEQNPQFRELFDVSPEGVELTSPTEFMAYQLGLRPIDIPEVTQMVRDYDSDDPNAMKPRIREATTQMPFPRMLNDPSLEPYLSDKDREILTRIELPGRDWTAERREGVSDEEAAAALERIKAAGAEDGYDNYKRFDVAQQLRFSPIMRYLYANPGKKAIMPVSNMRSFNTPGNDDDTMFLFPNPMPQFLDPNQDIYGMGREWERGAGRKIPFNDGSGRTFPRSFRMVPDTPNPVGGEEFEITGGPVVDPETGKRGYESAFAEGYEDMFEGRRGDSNRPRKVRGGPTFVDPMDTNPNSGFIRTIGAIHDSYPLPESTRLAELLANMPDRSLFDANPRQQRIYDRFMTAFPKDIEFWQAMSDNPMMSNDEAFALFNRIRGSYD